MTCIAYRSGILAADRCINLTSDGVSWGRRSQTKLVRLPTWHAIRAVAGFAGDSDKERAYSARIAAVVSEIGDELRKNSRYPFPDYLEIPGDDITEQEAIVLVVCGAVSRAYAGTGNFLERVPDGDYASVGADAAFAYGAFAAGAGAVCAVQAACRHGAYSAGPVDSVTFTSFELQEHPCI